MEKEENKFVRTKMRRKEGTKIELQRDICQIGFQIVADCLQVYCRLFSGYLQAICSKVSIF